MAAQVHLESHFVILGAGTFGIRGAEHIRHRWPHASITLVDRDPQRTSAAVTTARTVQGDAVSILDGMIDDQPDELIVIPAVPIHVAADWLVHRLSPIRRVSRLKVPPLPLPNIMGGESGDVYASHANFICPDHCNEPEEACPVTHRPHPRPMFDLITAQSTEALPIHCIRSEQLAPGVGGFQATRLLEIHDQITAGGSVLIATACRCHAVLSGLLVEQADAKIF